MGANPSPERLARLVKRLCRTDGEWEWVEYKRDNGNPEEIGEYISALANGAALNGQPHAYLFWGVEDGAGELVGTAFDPGAAKKGNEPLENWLHRLLDPHVHFEFHAVEAEGKRIVFARIDAAASRPVRFRGEAYVRVGQVKKRLKDAPERERALWRAFDRTAFESKVALPGATAETVLRLLDHPVYFDLLEIPPPANRDGILETLARDGLIREDDAGDWDILNLGAVLLARNLDSFPALKRKAVRIVRYSGSGRIETLRERIVEKGYAAGFEEAIGYIDALLPGREEIGPALRRTVSAYPPLAVRELVANMAIHQDFSISGAGPMVEIFADRVEISNPGKSLIETDRFVDAPPRSRNEAMASLMRRFGICEERGSGIDKVIFEVELAQLPAPLFETTSGSTRSVLFARKGFRNMNRRERIRAVYLHACLQHVTGKKMTNATLRRRFGILGGNAAIASNLLNQALAAGRIVVEDPTAGYRSRAYLPFWAAPDASPVAEFI